MTVFRQLAVSIFLWTGLSGVAHAACPGSALSNGTTADANQVMAWLNCKAPLDSPSFVGSASIANTLGATLVLEKTYGAAIQFERSGVQKFLVEDDSYSASNSLGIYAYGGGSWVNIVNFGTNGRVGIGTTAPSQLLHVAGTIRQAACVSGTLQADGNGDIVCLSDARLKNVHRKFSKGVDALRHLTPQLFSYKSEADGAFIHAGFIAQNVKASLPEAVVLQKDGYYGLDTTAILAASVNAIKELKVQNDKLAAENKALSEKLLRLEHVVYARLASK